MPIILIKELPVENNSIIDEFKNQKLSIKNALETQSLIELKTKNCDKQKCLNCEILNFLRI